jgi:hypothetical protein
VNSFFVGDQKFTPGDIPTTQNKRLPLSMGVDSMGTSNVMYKNNKPSWNVGITIIKMKVP